MGHTQRLVVAQQPTGCDRHIHPHATHPLTALAYPPQVLHERRRLQQQEAEQAEEEAAAGDTQQRTAPQTLTAEVQVLVTCSRPVDASLHAALVVAAGAPPSQFVPPQTLLWLLPAAAVHRVADVPGVVCPLPLPHLSLTHTHTHTHIYTYIHTEPSSVLASAIRTPSPSTPTSSSPAPVF